jgi:uncharacterized protein YecT (DUF1311 family)
MPVHWGKHQKGMQADFENEELVRSVYVPDFVSNKQAWLEARDRAVESAQAFAEAGYHKQIINRLIEPFSWSVGVVTATEWDNFFNLRDHPAAQPEIRLLAQRIKEAINASTPALLLEGDWHLPYILPEERSLPTEVKKKISAARCARVSYKTLDTGVNSTVDKDIQLFKSLADEGHMSPMEHQAVSYSACPEFFETNFRGWVQFRTEIESYKYEPN